LAHSSFLLDPMHARFVTSTLTGSARAVKASVRVPSLAFTTPVSRKRT
jgi:hypothetical protein